VQTGNRKSRISVQIAEPKVHLPLLVTFMSQKVPSLLHEADEFLFLPLLLVAVQGHRRGVFRHMNDTGHVDDAPTTTNYTTGKLCLDNPGACESEGDKLKHRA
jgi:hypothetical protein